MTLDHKIETLETQLEMLKRIRTLCTEIIETEKRCLKVLESAPATTEILNLRNSAKNTIAEAQKILEEQR